jgi:hypothetical protein
MPSVRIQQFGGVNTEVSPRLSREDVAQVAHNCLLWDGTLRPLAKWVSNQGGLNGRYTIMFDGTNIVSKNLEHAVKLDAPVYVPGTVVGLNPSIVDSDRSNICYQNNSTQIDQITEVGVTAPVISDYTNIGWTTQHLSAKPVNRLYAASLVRNNYGKLEESPLALLPEQNFTDLHYEGDSCRIDLRISNAPVRERCYIRLYRSISALETGQEIANILDTDWYMVAELKNYVAYLGGVFREYTYIDGGSPVAASLDTYLAGHFYPPHPYTYKLITATEGGWIAAATSDGNVCISERYMTHAWPTENTLKIPGTLTGMVAFYDNLFIGTDNEPYIVSIGVGEALNTQVSPKPFHESYACLPGSMVRSGSGALYASSAGLVALSQDGMRVITAGLANGVRPIYHIKYTAADTTQQCTDLSFQDTSYGAYFRGTYFGFCSIPTVDEGVFLSTGYMFDTGSTLDGSHPTQRLATFDYPDGTVISHCITNDGLAVLANNAVWTMALPNMPNKNSYSKSLKQCYRWKSKKYVFPGTVTFAFAKVVHDCDGFVRLKIYCDGICVYDTAVSGSQPIALPPSVVGVTWEVEVHGTATVHEIHMATSISELTEQ